MLCIIEVTREEDRMKKTILLTAVFLVCAALLFGAEGSDNSVVYRNIKVYKVYAHPDAYIIMYYTNSMDLGQVTVPTEWFKSGSGKGVLNSYQTSVTPYMTLQYKDGAFTKIVLNMPLLRTDMVWETMNQTDNIEAAKQKDTLKLE